MSKKPKYGSFNATFLKVEDAIMDCYTVKELPNTTKVTHLVNPLSQNEMAEGWRLVIPKPEFKYKETVFNGQKYKKKIYLYNNFKINLAQLPEHLECKLKPVYEEGLYSHSVARDNRYVYIVNKTPVDKEIQQLKSLLSKVHNTEEDTEAMYELLQVLQDNEIHGWPILRAKKRLEKSLNTM